MNATIAREPFGETADGARVDRYTLVNGAGAVMRVMTLGGVITHLEVPDQGGALGNTVLGYDTLAGYLAKSPHFGAITGRFANRIANGRFTIDGTTYQLDLNKGGNALHGGVHAFDRVVWHAEPFSESGSVGLQLRYRSPDGDQRFPGALDTVVTYRWSDENVLTVEYHATTDKPTPVNLTQHSYFNLAGAGNGDVLAHQLVLDADFYTPVNDAIIPTGEIAPVENTPFDFRRAHAIGARIREDNVQLRIAGGYDHNFVIRGGGSSLARVAHVVDPSSGRTLTLSSTEPGVQLYTGNGLDGTIVGSGGRAYPRYGGFCLETQHFPDAPNQPAFPDTILRPGDVFRSETRFAFGVGR